MQYIDRTVDDLKSGYTTYLLSRTNDKEIDFIAYTGDTALGADEEAKKLHAYSRGYFLRKGFDKAISDADPNVITPIYKDNENYEVPLKSKEKAIELIYASKLNISGFRFNENATDQQKEEAFGKLINSFVLTSKNLDFDDEKNLFFVMQKGARVGYNNGGNKDMKIRGVDVQERLGLNTEEVVAHKKRREMMQHQHSS